MDKSKVGQDFPKLLFKFKNTACGNSLGRIDEIISENKLFFPDRNKLNDPFEGLKPINMPGYAGISIVRAADEEPPVLREKRNQYKILSLSATCFSPLMWAYYGDECRGICLCFRSDQSFSSAAPVVYRNGSDEKTETEIPEEIRDRDIHDSFFVKHPDWQYEKEWRIVEKTVETFFPFDRNELVAVIFGHRIDKGSKRIIQRMLPDGINQYYTHIGAQSGAIRLLPEGYQIEYAGKEPAFISTVEELYLDIVT